MVCYNPPIAPHHYVQFEPPVLLNGSNTFGAWRDQVDPLLWFMSCRVPTLVPGSRSNTPTLPPRRGGIPAWSLGSSRVAPCKVAIRQRIARSGASPVHHRTTSRNVGPNHHFPRGLVAVLSPPSHVEAPLRSAQPRPWSSPVARVSPGDLRDFPWSLQHRLADARATPRLRFRRSGRIASVGQRLAGLSQEGSLSTSGGGSPQSGRAPFGAEPGGRAPFGAAGRHLARPGAIWRGGAPFGASREVVTSRRVPVEGGKLT